MRAAACCIGTREDARAVVRCSRTHVVGAAVGRPAKGIVLPGAAGGPAMAHGSCMHAPIPRNRVPPRLSPTVMTSQMPLSSPRAARSLPTLSFFNGSPSSIPNRQFSAPGHFFIPHGPCDRPRRKAQEALPSGMPEASYPYPYPYPSDRPGQGPLGPRLADLPLPGSSASPHLLQDDPLPGNPFQPFQPHHAPRSAQHPFV